jgi:hypothetical protein
VSPRSPPLRGPMPKLPAGAAVIAIIRALLRARWSPPGELSLDGCWTAYATGYLYIADTRWALVRQVWTEWEHDRHLAG